MGIAKCYSAHLVGLQIEIITIEVDISNGLNSISIVGLGDRAVEEAKDRFSAAIKNSGFVSPKQKNQKVVISLAPADVRKEGPAFDLPMALTYLAASKEINFNPDKLLILGELSLEGSLRKVSGLLPILCQAKSLGFEKAIVPKENSKEASLAADSIQIFTLENLTDAVSLVSGSKTFVPVEQPLFIGEAETPAGEFDMKVIRGNDAAKRGLLIAAAGAHNIFMHGPPGTGKTMLAQSFQTILPPLDREQIIEVTGIYSAAHFLGNSFITRPPFRAPHHTASYPAIVGGGSIPKPGEITLAHRGVLFLDEFPEFDRTVLEALRQPLESREITIARAKGTVTFPAQCILIASMNPCPCGRPKNNTCSCTAGIVSRYRRRISGPIFDRFDLWVCVDKVDYEKMAQRENVAPSSKSLRLKVIQARKIQEERFRKFGINKRWNAEMSADDISRCVVMEDSARTTLSRVAYKLELSGRSFHRIVKLSQTIADLRGSPCVTSAHILESLQYRQKMDY